ncbi:hypothetical protein LX24_02964 [Desulfallas thermosapovorans DSM 6562]|uniref:Alpha/beta hydrolase n=1 Tax=Desulfallas thermosapovorans DSM 6562 TaxID=1121431 RepID=A0A5S4ZN60_9FIRM|nr:hypothetical protein LX24_02964 [Desulfallas thermosapovorans DSM 6562]
MPFAKINGININYEIRGTGPRVLFIHGIGADLKHSKTRSAGGNENYDRLFRQLCFKRYNKKMVYKNPIKCILCL